MKHALHKLKKDRRDFQLGQYFDLPSLSDLPDEFILPAFEAKHQGGSDFCTAYTTCALSELQEGVRLEPAWSFAVSKQISGDIGFYGQDLRTAFKAHADFGAVEESECPYNVQKQSVRFLRDIKNYPPLFEKAKKHKKQSYFLVKGKYDYFDDIRASIWFFRDFKQGAGSGLLWSFPTDQAQIPNVVNKEGSGHAIPYIGWKKINGEPYLVARNSYGPGAGENGDFYFPRKVVNYFAEMYGAFMMVDVSPEEVKKQLWGVLEKLKDVLMKLLVAIRGQTPVVEPAPVVPVLPPPLKPSLLGKFAKAIEEYEGFYIGSRAYRNKNPGNLKYTSYTVFLGAIAKDNDNFCVFSDYAAGFKALCRLIEDAGNNRLKAYKDCDIRKFFNAYAPVLDKNEPDEYAGFVAKKLGVPIETKIKDLL